MDEKTIPYQRLQDLHGTDFAAIFYDQESDKSQIRNFPVHRDDNYLFIVVDDGPGTFEVDFHKCGWHGRGFFHICPGQVHSNIDVYDDRFWTVLVSPHLISKENADILNEFPRRYEHAEITDEQYRMIDSILKLLTTIDKLPDVNRLNIRSSLIEAFINICVQIVTLRSRSVSGCITETSRKDEIARQFCRAVSLDFPRLKTVSDFASMLNISSIYLSEVVKSMTGQTPSSIIMSQLILEVKRQLMFTNSSVKEIAYNIGYDEAYLSRLFKKKEGMSPTEFRTSYLK